MRGRSVHGWRRIASAMWRDPEDPQIYGALDLDARPVMAFVERARAAGHRVTPVISHDMPSAFRIADRIAMLHDGTIVARIAS